MSPDEFKALTEDIKKNGQRQPIAIIERARRRPDGTFHVSDPPLQEVLDGISRLDAMEAAGIAVIGKDGNLTFTRHGSAFTLSNGEHVPPEIAVAVINDVRIVSQLDGLFPSLPQSWKYIEQVS